MLLGPKHTRMRVSATGIIRNTLGVLHKNPSLSWVLSELIKHMEELGQRFYSGDVLVVDEFLQLYALDANRPKENPFVPLQRKNAIERIHKLSFEERAVWGDCPVCAAKDGEKCNPNAGLLATLIVAGETIYPGAHPARLDRAPKTVRIVPV